MKQPSEPAPGSSRTSLAHRVMASGLPRATDWKARVGLFEGLLCEDILPFWEKHGFTDTGPVLTCMDDAGRILSEDRWGWSQWRALWVCNELASAFPQKPLWRKRADRLYNWLRDLGPDGDGHWPLLWNGRDAVVRGFESIYNDGFAAYALTAHARATGSEEAVSLARNTFHTVQRAFRTMPCVPTWPYASFPGEFIHGLSMIFSLVWHDLAMLTGDQEIRAAADRHASRVRHLFWRKEEGILLEMIAPHGDTLPPPRGTVVVPGHAIESLWFQLEIDRQLGRKTETGEIARGILCHLESGWDSAHGGIFLAIDSRGPGHVPDWGFHDSKLWWPQVEALVATLLAYEQTGDMSFLDWHDKVLGLTLQRYPVPEHGEWYQRLDREGKPFEKVVALPVKDPFHLPRALLYCLAITRRLANANTDLSK